MIAEIALNFICFAILLVCWATFMANTLPRIVWWVGRRIDDIKWLRQTFRKPGRRQ
jgi:hypothetical protein